MQRPAVARHGALRGSRRACAVRVIIGVFLALVAIAVLAPNPAAQASVRVTWGAAPSGWEIWDDTSSDQYTFSGRRDYVTPEGAEYSGLVSIGETIYSFASLDEFRRAGGNDPISERPEDSDGQYWERKWSGLDFGTTQIAGKPAYYTTFTVETSNVPYPVSTVSRSAEYWVDLGNGRGVRIVISASGDAWVNGAVAGSLSVSTADVETLWAEAQSIYNSMKFDWGSGATTDTSITGTSSTEPSSTSTTDGTGVQTPTESDGKPWKTAAGGAAAVVAAVVAILTAAAKTPSKPDDQRDPTKPIGYILHVSADKLSLSRAQSQPFTVRVLQVMIDGRTEPAAANIALTAPPGAGVEAAAGPSPLSTLVWQKGNLAAGAGLLVQATAAGGSSQTTVAIAGEGDPKLNVVFEPTDKQQLIVGGGDRVTLVAIVELPPALAADPSLDLVKVRNSIEFTSASEWLDLSAAVDWGEGRAINVEASQPDPNHPKDPPPTCMVQVKAEAGGGPLSQNISIAMVFPAIDAKPDTVEFAADSRSIAEVTVWIDPPSGPQWEFETAWREGSRALARVELERTGPATCGLKLTEDSAGKLDPNRPEDSATLRVLAKAPGCPDLERYILVLVGQEGLFIDPTGRNSEDGSYHVLADGRAKPKEIDFRVYVRETDGSVRLDKGLAQNLQFTPTDESDSRSHNGAEVAELTIVPAGLRQLEPPSATYRAGVKSPIPGDVPVLPVRFDVSAPGQADQEKFTKQLILGLVPSRNAPGGPDWQREYDRCLEIINGFVPLKYQLDLKRILERRGRHLGADGLYELRRQVWVIAQDLTLGEGGMGYHDEAKWANRITTVLQYAEWAGTIAFHAATTHFVGPWAALGIAQVRELVVSAIVAYEEGLTPEDWLWQNIGALPLLLEGQAIDVDKFTKLANNSKIKAWALFVGYHFFKNYFYNGKSFTDSLIEAGRAARDEAIAAWLGKKLKEGAGGSRPPDVQKPKEAEGGADGPSGSSAQTRARDWAQRIKDATSGGEKLTPEMVAEIMRDPDAARELRRTDPDAYSKYADARGEMRDAHDTELTQTLKDRYGRDVRVETVGTERGIDRDYRVMVEVPDPSDPSKSMWVELPPSDWAADSHRILAGQTGGPTGPDSPELRAQQAQHAQGLQQLPTDVNTRQACADMSDQYWVKDAQGNLVPTQRIGPDPKTGEMRPLTNIECVENGDGRLISGEKTGETYQDKVADSMTTGLDGKPQPTLDAITQANKAGESLDGCRSGYEKQGLNPGPLDPKVAQGMNIIKQGAEMGWTPAETDRALRQQAGIDGGLKEYMDRVGKGFAQLDGAK